ncbi:unnamed protein product [Bemisia tabaci]|uniref:Double-stranded RNA-specific editase Adar n=1 Tax=Bemisia tabaci TaxID=7038 RepID=A0A9P0EZT7_BEMTA|nr:unnamed protein product [Bemisia tabaci]
MSSTEAFSNGENMAQNKDAEAMIVEDENNLSQKENNAAQNENSVTKNGTNNPHASTAPACSAKKKKKMKRKFPNEATGVAAAMKRPKLSLITGITGLVTPASKLNEFYPGLKYEVSNQKGPSHNPIFTCTVKVNDQTFTGTGKSKKQAKHNAAQNALKGLNIPTYLDQEVMADQLTNGNSTAPRSAPLFSSFSSPNESGSGISPVSANRNALAVINEIRPGLAWKVNFEQEQMINKFFASIIIDGEEFTGRGISKKAAKIAAASSFLAKINASPLNANRPKCDFQQLNPIAMQLPGGALTTYLADSIARAIENKFLSMASKVPSLSKYKVLAGIIMTRDENYSNLEVVSFGTGTKCINGGKLSLDGYCVHDCHGEILSRRALCSFFYHNLHLLSNPDQAKHSIFEKSTDWDGYELKKGIRFFLYINTAPCGDGRLFSPQEEKDQQLTPDKHPNRINRGLLRTKIESGEGTVKLDENKKLQTWDGIIQGERLLTMSCSDKIAKWNTVGLQGALLSHFIKPVYLTGIVIGSLFSPSHLYRAVIGRLEGTLQALPPPYRLNKPLLETTSSNTERLASKTPNHAVVWSADMLNVEAMNAINGRQLDTSGVPCISKRKLFEKFLQIAEKVPSPNFTHLSSLTVYSEAKKAAKLYQEAKLQTFKAFSQGKLGDWLKKPAEVDEFEVAPADVEMKH